MTKQPATLENRRLMAPRHDRQTFHDPSAANVRSVWSSNLKRISRYDFCVHGHAYQSLRESAKRQFLAEARDYTSNVLNANVKVDTDADFGIVVSGHQPELFHAGVWYKNFLINQLANTLGAIPVNLVVDYDVNTSMGIYVPAGSNAHRHRRWVALDERQSSIPFEDRPIFDQQRFSNFPKRIEQFERQTGIESIATHLWEFVNKANHRINPLNLGESLTFGRTHLEREFGINNLEIPVSLFCRQTAFSVFFAEIVSRIDEFTTAYNESIVEYQRINAIKSSSHPLPPLSTNDQWHELPFWIWSQQDPIRRRLYVKTNKQSVEFSSLHHSQKNIVLSADDLGAVISKIEAQKIKIRPRALSMTMFTRMFLSDLFVHGIGGAKYDQMTDNIIRRFFNVEPPTYMAATATLQLPIAIDLGSATSLRELKSRKRDIQFHPEYFFDRDKRPEILHWIKNKRSIIQSLNGTSPSKQQHHTITELNEILSRHLDDQKKHIDEQISEAKHNKQIAEIVNWREYSYVLHPRSLASELVDLAKRAVNPV